MPTKGTAEKGIGSTMGGGFFAVDGTVWARVCQLGANPAAAYLVLARGTGRDHRTSSWSVNAIEGYTGLSRGRARDALRKLQALGFVAETQGGTRPRYDLVPAAEVSGQRRALSDYERTYVLDEVARGKQPGRRAKTDYHDRLVADGWLVKREGRYEVAPPPATTPAWVWLPNTLVDGVEGHLSAVEAVRQSADALLVRLLVDCYGEHALAEDGGISRRFVYQTHERVRVGQQGLYVVWGFRRHLEYVTWGGFTEAHKREPTAEEQKASPGANCSIDFFRRFSTLQRLGLVEWVPYLVESGAPDSQPIHPVGQNFTTPDAIEDAIGYAAHRAGLAMLTPAQQDWVMGQGLHLVPVPAHREHVQLVGVARLRHRPHTRATSAWWGRLMAEGAGFLEHYRALTAQALAHQPLSPPMQHQGFIKVSSR